jgi:hypothetical protein
VKAMMNKTKIPTDKVKTEQKEEEKEHKLKDAFNALGQVNLAIAK